MTDSYIINNHSIPCYNMSYDQDSNQYLRVPNRNSISCNHLSNIHNIVYNSYIKLKKLETSYKCSKETQVIEFDTNCISCNDKNIQKISTNLENSLIDLEKLKQYIKTNDYDYNNFKEVYTLATRRLDILQNSIQDIDDEVLEELFDDNFLYSTFINTALKYITLGLYTSNSGNTIDKITENMYSIKDNLNYLDQFF